MRQEWRAGIGTIVKPGRVTVDMLKRAQHDDLWHFAGNLNAMLDEGYCDNCGMTPEGCNREGCRARELIK